MNKNQTEICNLESCGEIAERRLAEQRLSERQRHYHDILHNLSDAIYLVEVTEDNRFRYLETNRAFEAMMGVADDGMLEKCVGEVLRSSGWEVSAEHAIAKFHRCLELGHAISGEITLDTPSGRRILSSTLTPLFDDSGRITRILGTSRDVTASKQTERLNDFLAFALDQANDAVFLIDPADGHRFSYVNDQASSSLGYSRDELLKMSVLDIDPVMDTGAARQVDEQILEQAFVRFETFHRRKNGLVFPVEISATQIEHDGQTLSLAIVRDISERKCNEQKMASREREYRNLAESLPNGIIRYDLDGRIRYLNAGLLVYLGLNAADVIGKKPSEAWPDGRYADIERASARTVATGESTTVEFSEADAAGDLHFNQISIVPERDGDGQIVGTLAIGHDVTAIRQAERKLSHFIATLPGMAYSFRLSPDGHGCMPFASPAIEQYYGLRPEDVKDDIAPAHKLVHPDDLCILEAAFAESARTMTPFRAEYRVCRPNIPVRWLEARSEPELQADGGILWNGIVLDITERKRAETALIASQRMLSEAQAIAKLGSWDWDVVKNRVEWSDMAYDIYTPDARPAAPGYEEFKQSVHPDDLERVDAAVRSAFEHDTPFNIEHRVVSKSKGVRIVHAQANVFRNQNGNPIRMVGTVQDITERQRIEQQLRASEERMRLFFERQLVGMAITSPEKGWLQANDKICEMFGYSREELAQLTWADLTYPDDLPADVAQFERMLNGEIDSYSMEKRYLHKDGRIVFIDLSVGCVRRADRSVDYVLALLADITERKRIELDRKLLTEILEESPDYVGTADMHGKLGYHNFAARRMIGLPDDADVSKLRIADMHPEWVTKLIMDTALPIVLEQGVWRGETALLHSDGWEIPVQQTIMLHRDANGKPMYTSTIMQDISERKHMEEQLRLKEFALDHASDAVYLMDDNGRFVYVNDQACRSLGCSRDELLGLTPLDIDPDVTPEIFRRVREESNAQGFSGCETRHKRRDGSVFPVEIRISSFDYRGQAMGFAFAIDISERKRMEEEREGHLRFFESMDRVNRAIQGSNDMKTVLNEVLEEMLDLFGCDRAYFLYPCDPEADSWSVPFERTRPEYPGALELGRVMAMDQEEESTFRLFLESGDPVTLGPGNQHPLPKKVAEQYGFRSLMSMAIFPNRDNAWAFGIHQCSHARAWTADEQKMFQEIGRRLADALTGLLAYREIQEREQKFGMLADCMPDSLCGYDLQMRKIYANLKLRQILAAKFGNSWLGKTPKELYLDGSMDEHQARLEHVIKTGVCEDLEGSMPDAQYGRRYFQTRYAALRDYDGKIIGVLAIFTYITKQRQLELELIRNERKFRTLVKNSPGFIARFDTEMRRTYVNQAYEETTKITEEEVLGKTPLEYWRLTVPDAEEFCTILRRVMATRQQERIEAHAVTATGAVRYFTMHMVPEFDDDGEIDGVLTTGIEITDMKNAERLKVEAREDERKVLARELHDDLGQRLTALRLDISVLELRFGTENPDLQAKIRTMESAVGETIKIVRSLLSMLRPAVLDLGLSSALTWLADEFRGRANVECNLLLPEKAPDLNEAQSVAIFRIVQESLTNIVKHAQAKKVSIALFKSDNAYLLEIQDDGKGFEFGASKKMGSFGLQGIKERVQMLGGILTVETAPGRGVKLTVQLPH